jgi:hypothetical protein
MGIFHAAGIHDAILHKLSKLNARLSFHYQCQQRIIAIAIKNNQGLINSELKSVSSVLSNIKVYVDKFRPSYIQRFGQQKYDELLQNPLYKTVSIKYILHIRINGSMKKNN